jgi:hypothetical protein
VCDAWLPSARSALALTDDVEYGAYQIALGIITRQIAVSFGMPITSDPVTVVLRLFSEEERAKCMKISSDTNGTGIMQLSTRKLIVQFHDQNISANESAYNTLAYKAIFLKIGELTKYVFTVDACKSV